MESNYEHYKNEIVAVFLCDMRCKFIKQTVFKRDDCSGVTCSECSKKVKEWLQQPYVEAPIEIDWTKVPVDTPVIVVGNSGVEYRRHFAKFQDNYVYAFDKGYTSWSAPKVSEDYISMWSNYRLVRPEDVEKYKKQTKGVSGDVEFFQRRNAKRET